MAMFVINNDKQPCPFCGSSKVFPSDIQKHAMFCWTCLTTVIFPLEGNDRERAVYAKWNTRPITKEN